MEEYNDLTKGPDDEGKLTLSYDDWTKLPHELYNEYKENIVFLDLSYNKLSEIPSHIGKLTLLKYFNTSHNHITRIDPAIGECIRLRKLDVSNNYIVSLPMEISYCTLLESLLCNNNKLQHIPQEISDLPALEIFHTHNNHLFDIPSKFGLIPCLKQIRCDGNVELVSIPQHIQSNEDVVLWALRLYHSFQAQKSERERTYKKIENEYKDIVYNKCVIEELASSLTDEVDAMKKTRPIRYIETKIKTQDLSEKLSREVRNKMQITKEKLKHIVEKIFEKKSS